MDRETEPMFQSEREEVIDDREPRGRRSGPRFFRRNLVLRAHPDAGGHEEGWRRLHPERGVVDSGDVDEEAHLKRRVLLEHLRDFEKRLRAEGDGRIAAIGVRADDRLREAIANGLNQGLRIHTENSGLGSGAGRSPVSRWSWILAWSFRSPSRTYSGRGGQPGI